MDALHDFDLKWPLEPFTVIPGNTSRQQPLVDLALLVHTLQSGLAFAWKLDSVVPAKWKVFSLGVFSSSVITSVCLCLITNCLEVKSGYSETYVIGASRHDFCQIFFHF